MAGVYVFDHDDVDIDTTGRVGDLQPTECTFFEEKNGESSLSLHLCYDPLNKWAAVKVGSYIKAQVPVRVPPRIVNDVYAEDIAKYMIRKDITQWATVWQSCGTVVELQTGSLHLGARPEGRDLVYPILYGAGSDVKKKQVKVLLRLKAGSEVQLLEERGERCKIYAKGFGTGWTLKSNLEFVEERVITGKFHGVENVEDAVRKQYQLFQVTSVEQTLDGVSVTAQHVFYELLHSPTTYKTEKQVPAATAINGVFDGMVTPDERFTCLTDTKDEAGPVDFERVNVVQALLDPENGICAKYGLSLIRNNYDLYALKNVGSDRGFVVEYGKNMLAVERTEDISNVVTRIIPFGKTKKGEIVYMDGTIFVDSSHIDEYAFPRTMYLDCSEVATESKEMTLDQVKKELKKQAQAEFKAGCDLPELSLTVDFVALGDTEEYAQYRDLDKVYMFDKITVKDKVRGYNYNAEVVAITYNVLTEMLESVTLGSIRKGTGTRKIATWQVPEVDGGNIRLESIKAGVLAGEAVSEANMQDGSVSTRVIEAKSVTAEKIAAGAITAESIEAGSVTTEKLDAGAVTADKIGAGAITTEKIAAGAVTANTIDASAITTEKIATGAITADSGIIADSAINTAQIADGSITSAKVVELNADVIKSGTLSTERLLLTGDDGLIYEINAKSSGLTAAELTDEQYKQQISGTVIVAESITAAQLAAEAVTANKILAGAVTADKIGASAVTADKIAAGAITTSKISADFGSSLDLTSNTSINQIVGGLTQTYMQYAQPSGPFNVGDVWIKTQNTVKWQALANGTWQDAQASLWGELGYTDQPVTYVWNGSKWVQTIDANDVAEALKTQSTIEQRADSIELKVAEVAGATPDKLRNSAVTINTKGVSVTGGEVNIQANSSLNIESGGTVKISAGNGDDSFITLGEAFSASLNGLSATNGSFTTLRSGGKKVLTEDNLAGKIVISATEPSGHGIIWLCPTSVASVDYSVHTGTNRNKFLKNTTQTLALACGSADTLPNSTFKYTVGFSVMLINDGSSEKNVVFSVTATKAADSSLKVTFPTYTLASIKEWQKVDIEMTVESATNLCADTGVINVAISASNLSTNYLCIQNDTYVTLTAADINASGSVQACSVYFKP